MSVAFLVTLNHEIPFKKAFSGLFSKFGKNTKKEFYDSK